MARLARLARHKQSALWNQRVFEQPKLSETLLIAPDVLSAMQLKVR